MTGSNSVKNYIIKNYNLHFGVKISEESALQDIVALCVDDAFCDNKLVSHIFSELHWSEITSLEFCLKFVCMAELLLKSAIRFEEGADGKLK